MKYLWLVALLLLACTAQAQRKPRPQPAPTLLVPIIYCELKEAAASTFFLEYGQDSPTYVQDADLDEADTYVRKLRSFPAALNYLYSRGWEVLSTSTVPHSQDKEGNVTSRQRCLLRRRTP